MRLLPQVNGSIVKSSMADSKKELLIIIDCFALIHRAFHAFPDSLVTSEGETVNAVYGFASLVMDVILKFKPQHAICVFDPPGPTVRNEMFVDYKANRGPADEVMIKQLPRIREFIDYLGIPLIEVAGYEADDVIGTLADRYETMAGHETVIVTGDRDMFQLVDEETSVYLAGGSFSKSKLYDRAGVIEKMGVAPEHIIDIKALEGDSSDNIPGVRGIGKKGAVDLVQEFGELNNIYANIEHIGKRHQQKLVDHQEMAQLSRKLATIIRDVPISFEFSEAKFGTFDADELRGLFMELEFRSILRKLDELVGEYKIEVGSLFNPHKQPQSDIEIANWEGEHLDGEVYVYLQVSDSDAIDKKVERLYILVGEQFLEVQPERTEQFEAAIGDLEIVVGNDIKSLVQLFGTPKEWWDLTLIGAIISGGAFKPVFDDLIEKFSGHKVADLTPAQVLFNQRDIYKSQYKKLQEEPGLQKIIDLEMHLIPVVGEMERSGLFIDKVELFKLSEKIDKLIDVTEQEIFADVGHEFNIASPKQVGEVLFGERGLPGGKKTKTGSYSTSERVLKNLITADPSCREDTEVS